MKRAMAILGLCVGAAWSSTALAQSSITRHAAFAYDGPTGLLTQETIEPGSTQWQLQTNTFYDAFGNKTKVTTLGYGFDTREADVTYDSLGQFVTSTTKVVSDNTNQNETDIYQYDTATGRLAYHLDPNGLATMWYYDSFGRKTLEVRPDGTRTTFHYDLCNACIGFSVYSVTATPLASNGYTVNGPISTIYFDSLDREVGRDTLGFDGSTISGAKELRSPRSRPADHSTVFYRSHQAMDRLHLRRPRSRADVNGAGRQRHADGLSRAIRHPDQREQ